jgi:hypothetical protein
MNVISVVVIAIGNAKNAARSPWQGIGGVLLRGGLDEAGFLPPAIFADSHALAPFGKLDEPGSLAVRY